MTYSTLHLTDDLAQNLTHHNKKDAHIVHMQFSACCMQENHQYETIFEKQKIKRYAAGRKVHLENEASTLIIL